METNEAFPDKKTNPADFDKLGDNDNINNKHQFYRLAKHQLGVCIT